MIRILHYIGGLNPGGAETFIMNVYKNIDRDKIQFDFIVDHIDQNFYYNDVKELGGKIFEIKPVYKIGYCRFKKQLNNIIDNEKYKIIHVHVRSTASLIFKAIKKKNIYKIMHSHNNSNGKGLQAIIKKLSQFPLKKQPDYKMACSIAAGQFVFTKKGIKDNFSIVPNGIDTIKYSYNVDDRNSIRKKYGISENEFVFGHVGRFVEQKNHKFILALAKKMADCKFLLIGDGPLKSEMEKIASKNVIFVGNTTDVNKFYSAFDCFLLPSLWEGLGIVLIEAQYNGLQCIVSDSIQQEAIISKNVIKLELSIDRWVDYIKANCFIPNERSFYVYNDSYDIKNVSIMLQNFYSSIRIEGISHD